MPFEGRGPPRYRGFVREVATCTNPPADLLPLETWTETLELLGIEPARDVEQAVETLEAWARARSIADVVAGLTAARLFDPEPVLAGFSSSFDVRALWVGAALLNRVARDAFLGHPGSRLVVQVFNLQDDVLDSDDPDRVHDFCVRLLRDAEPADGPLARHATNAELYDRALPRDLRALLGVRIVERFELEESASSDTWWARDPAFEHAWAPRILTTFEIHTHLTYPLSMVGAFDSAAVDRS